MKHFFKGLVVALCLLCGIGVVNAGPKVKALSVFPYENVIESVPLYDDNLAEKQCTTEIIPNVGFVEGEDTPASYTPSSFEPGECRFEQGSYTPSTHSFTPAIGNGVNFTNATFVVEACTYISVVGGMIKYDCCNGDPMFVFGVNNIDERYVQSYPHDFATGDVVQCTKSGNYFLCPITTHKALAVVKTADAVCTAKPITQAVDNYTSSSMIPGTFTKVPGVYTPSLFTEGSCAKAVQVTQNATIECPEDLTGEVPTRDVTLEQLITKSCVGDTIKVRGSGFVYPKNENQAKQIIKSRFAVFYQKPGKLAYKRIISEDRELADIVEGEFKEEREFEFKMPGTYTFRFWVYNRGVATDLGVARVVEVVEGCKQVE